MLSHGVGADARLTSSCRYSIPTVLGVTIVNNFNTSRVTCLESGFLKMARVSHLNE